MTIRVALIGLSSSAVTSWASAAHLPYLLSERGIKNYKIVALLNSSIESGKKSIKQYNLPEDTKVYADPQALADDPDVDLVVCNTRVDVHHKTSLPSVKAGKAVFIEWPLSHNVQASEELVAAAGKAGGKTIVGIQGRFAPAYVKVKEIIESGQIGKVLSTHVALFGGLKSSNFPSGLEYFTDKKVGGNPVTIAFGHIWDPVQEILGDVSNIQPRAQIQRPKVNITTDGKVTHQATTDVPDLVLVTGTLAAHNDASLLFQFRLGNPFKGSPAHTWTIYGEKGEIRLTSWNGSLNFASDNKDASIEVHDFASDELTQVEWKWESWQEELPILSRGIGKIYDEFANGKPVATFAQALKRQQQIQTILDN